MSEQMRIVIAPELEERACPETWHSQALGRTDRCLRRGEPHPTHRGRFATWWKP